MMRFQPPGTPAHGASKHTDRTRVCQLPIGGASQWSGGPGADLASRGANGRHRAWAFDDGSVNVIEGIVLEFIVPQDFVSLTRFDLHWANSGTNSGNVRWGIVTKARAAGDDLNSTSGETNVVMSAAAVATAGQLVITAHSAAPNLTAGGLINVLVFRFGNHAADTLSGDAWLAGLSMVYTADM